MPMFPPRTSTTFRPAILSRYVVKLLSVAVNERSPRNRPSHRNRWSSGYFNDGYVWYFIPSASIAVAGEGQRQRQHLAVDRQSAATGLRDGVQAFAGRDVHEGGAGSRPRCQSHPVLEGELFDELRVDEMDVVPVPLASLLGQQVVVHHQLIVLAVD